MEHLWHRCSDSPGNLIPSSCHLLNSVPTTWQWAIKALPKSVQKIPMHRHKLPHDVQQNRVHYCHTKLTWLKVLMLKLELHQTLWSTCSHSSTTLTCGHHFPQSEFLEAEHRILLLMVENKEQKEKCTFSSKPQIIIKKNPLSVHKHIFS